MIIGTYLLLLCHRLPVRLGLALVCAGHVGEQGRNSNPLGIHELKVYHDYVFQGMKVDPLDPRSGRLSPGHPKAKSNRMRPAVFHLFIGTRVLVDDRSHRISKSKGWVTICNVLCRGQFPSPAEKHRGLAKKIPTRRERTVQIVGPVLIGNR